MPYPKIDPMKLKVWPLAERHSEIRIDEVAADPDAMPAGAGAAEEQIARLVERIVAAKRRGASVMLAYGAHLVKNGAGPLVAALIERGWVTHVCTQGAGVIHDWEFAFAGCSSESVRRNAPIGRFGAWDETGRWINLAVLAGAAEGLGLGESVGRMIEQQRITLPDPDELAGGISADPAHPLAGARADLLWSIRQFDLAGGEHVVDHPYRRHSILWHAYRHRVPLTIHPSIGYDIIINHPMYHGGAMGRAAATDARVFAQGVAELSGGVYLSVGSAIMSPQIFEKAFSAANNLRHSAGQPFISDHYMAVIDLQDGGGWNWTTGEPPKDNPAYYLRYCKTFSRMGGTLDYIQCDNRLALANLAHRLPRQ